MLTSLKLISATMLANSWASSDAMVIKAAYTHIPKAGMGAALGDRPHAACAAGIE